MVRSNLRFVSPVVFNVSSGEAAEAYEQARPDLDAVPAESVARVIANIPSVVSTVFGALPAIEALGGDIKRLPFVDHALLAKLRLYALALYYVHILISHAADSTQVNALMAEATRLRARLLSSVETLSVCGYVDPAQVAAIRKGSGHLDTANDLVGLEQIFRAGGDAFYGMAPVTRAEVARAGELGLQIVAALGRRKVGSEAESATTRRVDDRARAFWLVVRSYNEARRAVTFLRWNEGDADQLVPSLFAGKPRRRNRPDDEPSDGGGEGEGDNGVRGSDDADPNATGTQ
jgi:hypothetical protein